MTKKQEEIEEISWYLHKADFDLRDAMVLAGKHKMKLVSVEIMNAQLAIDDALTRWEQEKKIVLKESLTNSKIMLE